MRLLYVIDSIGRGGAETSLAAMAPGLIAAGIELHVATLSSTRLHQLQALLDAGATVHVPEFESGRLANVRWLLALIRRLGPDLVHTTLFEADIAGRLAGQVLGIPTSTSIVNDSYSPSHYEESNNLKLHVARFLDAATSLSARRFHAITASIADSVGARLGIPRSKIDVVHRGRDPHDFPYRSPEARRHIRRELSIPPTAHVILSVGRHEPQKGLTHLMEALPSVTSRVPEVVVLQAGKEGRSSSQLRAQVTDSGADVRFLGHRRDIAQLLSAADVFCFPSEREGFGGVLIEAMATGCPIVASDIPTTREVLSPTSTSGYLAPVKDPEALANGLIQVLTNTEVSRCMAEAARRRFEDHFTIDGVTAAMAEFFERAASCS